MSFMKGNKILSIKLSDIGLPYFTANGTRAAGLFQDMKDLKSVPEYLNLKNATSFENMFKGCTYLENAPLFDTSNGTNFHGMFRDTRRIHEVPEYDTSKGTDFSDMFRGSNILKAPKIDTSKGNSFYRMFASAPYLQELPEIITVNGRNFGYMFNYCKNMLNEKEITYDTLAAQNFSYMFNECHNMKVAPIMNTYNGKSFAFMFNNCYNLVTIPKLYLTNAEESYFDENNMATYSGFSNMFNGCSNLENITIQGYIYHNINFYSCQKLTHESLMSIINALGNFSSSSEKHTCYLGSTNLAKLSDEEKAAATVKGWTLY